MGEKRVNWTPIQLAILYNQVNGICPICQKPLWYEKEGQIKRSFEVAHIYPLNPTKEEEVVLKDQPKLFEEDKNDLNNVIALCQTCHSYVDNPTSVQTYIQLYNLKKEYIRNEKISSLYSSYDIEEDIIGIVNAMTSELDDSIEKLSYDLITVDYKINKENVILKSKVKNDVSQYYLFIRSLFYEIDKSNSGTFDLIAGQIKAFYLKVKTISNSQEEIYEQISKWLYNKYKIGYIETYKIIVSFFIQDCEVFSDVTK